MTKVRSGARCLDESPLLDEHTAALDPKSADQIVSQHKLTTMMVTHSMQQAATLGTRIVMMNQGSIYADCSGSLRRHSRAEDLIRRFDEIRHDEGLDASAAEVLRVCVGACGDSCDPHPA